MTLTRNVFRPVAILAVTAVLFGLTGCVGGSTSSPEGTARAFLEAMKENSLSAAMALVNPALGDAHVEQTDATFFMPDVEHSASPTGVADYEIINQSTASSSSGDTVSITARLVGASIPDITFTISLGGASGNDWLIHGLTPGFRQVTLNAFDLGNGTVTLSGGTDVPLAAERIVLLPGSDLTGARWNDFEGFYEEVELGLSASSGGDLRWLSVTPTNKAFTAASAFFEDARERELARAMAPVLADPARFRVLSEPSFGEWQLAHEDRLIAGTMEVDLGEIEVCLIETGWGPGTTTWKLDSRTFDGSPVLPGFAVKNYSLVFNPYDPDAAQPGDPRLFGGTADHVGNRVVQLADCGA